MICPTEGSGNQSKKTSSGKSRKKKDLEEDLPDQRLQVQTASEIIEPRTQRSNRNVVKFQASAKVINL